MLDIFLEWMPGVYSNNLQAYSSPFEFPMLRFNIELLPLLVDEMHCFRVEQYKPSIGSEPYRVGYFTVNVLGASPDAIIIRNYESIDFSSMEFVPYDNAILEAVYDPSRQCFEAKMKTYGLKKGNSLVTVQSYLKVSADTIEVLDRGYDPVTDKLLWGLNYGPAILKKEKN
jgi:hypothetical protein